MLLTHGHDDPTIPDHVRSAHDRAVAAGDKLYLDPLTGSWAMTSLYLEERGTCCGKCCRHCPYPREVQEAAGRRVLR